MKLNDLKFERVGCCGEHHQAIVGDRTIKREGDTYTTFRMVDGLAVDYRIGLTAQEVNDLLVLPQ